MSNQQTDNYNEYTFEQKQAIVDDYTALTEHLKALIEEYGHDRARAWFNSFAICPTCKRVCTSTEVQQFAMCLSCDHLKYEETLK